MENPYNFHKKEKGWNNFRPEVFVLYFLETVVKRWCLHGSLHYRLKDRIKKMKSRKFHIIWITARNTAMNDSDVNSLVIRGQKLDSADIFSIAKDVYEQPGKSRCIWRQWNH